MRNVIKYRTHCVLCLVDALVFAIKISRTHTDCIYIDLALPMELTVISFTSAVNNHCCRLESNPVFKSVPPICQLLLTNDFLCKYFGFLGLKCSKTWPHTTSNNTFASAVWNLLQENISMLPAWFVQATIWLVVIDNSKLMRPAVCSGERQHGLISRTAAVNWE